MLARHILYGCPVSLVLAFLTLSDAMPQFRKKYGEQLPDGTYQVTAPWQAGLSNGAVVGEIVWRPVCTLWPQKLTMTDWFIHQRLRQREIWL